MEDIRSSRTCVIHLATRTGLKPSAKRTKGIRPKRNKGICPFLTCVIYLPTRTGLKPSAKRTKGIRPKFTAGIRPLLSGVIHLATRTGLKPSAKRTKGIRPKFTAGIGPFLRGYRETLAFGTTDNEYERLYLERLGLQRIRTKVSTSL